jgi:uncharacterized SAM-binding protein YcdF (DUF218 family)
MFWFKKFVGGLLMPLPLALLFLLAGVWCLWRRPNRKAGRLLVTLATALLVASSNGYVAGWSLNPLRERYGTPFDPAGAQGVPWVVVLGAGHSDDPTIPSTDRLSSAALYRLAEGIRVHRAIPGSRLLLSGWGGPGATVSHAQLLAEAAQILGVPPSEIEVEGRPRDTEEEARLITERLGQSRFVVVTTALHMRRAMELFRANGAQPIPAASELPTHGEFHVSDLVVPQAYNVKATEAAWHEYLGMAWGRIRGATD